MQIAEMIDNNLISQKKIHVMENFEKYTTPINLIIGGLKKPSLPLSQTSKQRKVLRCVTPIIAPSRTILNPVVEPKKIYIQVHLNKLEYHQKVKLIYYIDSLHTD